MSGPTLCVTLTARTVDGARAAVAAAAADGGDLAEIRFDRWTAEERARARELFPSALPLVATYRSIAEGGEGSVDPELRGEVLGQLRRLPFAAVDRERARDGVPPAERAERSIASRHLAAPVDWTTLSELAGSGCVAGERPKLVVPATIGEFLGPLPGALPATGTGGAITQTVGPSGPLSRVWPGRLGSAWVFAAPGPSDPIGERPVERSQLPVDRLRSVLRRTPAGPLFAVVGHPIDFTESPALHHRWMRAAGLDGAYLALDVETERELRDLLDALGPGGFRGVNVTHPWKRVARAAVRSAESDAIEADAANCLTWDGHEWRGALTDVDALARRLGELRTSGRWEGRELTLLGSGAAARATLLAARRLGAQVRLRARDPRALDELRRRFPETLLGAAREPASLLVQATASGRAGGAALAFGIDDLLRSGGLLLDLVYGDPPSPLAERCAAAEVEYEDGRRLLEYQAMESFRRWWGRPPEGAPRGEAGA